MAREARSLGAVLGERGPLRARDLVQALGVSQPTLSRIIRGAGPTVRRIGRARATRYALAREVGTLGSTWPVYRIAPDGRVHAVARFHALAPSAWWYETRRPAPALLPGPAASGLFSDLPWFFDDLRPQGFMGRAFARRHGPPLGLSDDPRRWSPNAVTTALLLHGDDLPGDLVLGEAAVARAQQRLLDPPPAIPRRHRLARYAALAEEALAGGPVGSSAAGEQPKFTAPVRDHRGDVRHVLVKISPPLSTPAGKRWADLLLCEHLAAEVLAADGIPASRTEWLTAKSRAFLEVTRFDRTGEAGRLGSVSLLALDAELYGRLDTWAHAANRLAADGFLAPADARRLQVLWWFGRLIDNSDMHFGNVSLCLRDALPLDLAPSYDMLPMRHQPSATGEIVLPEPVVEPPPPEFVEAWRTAADLAARYWDAVLSDRRVSPAFRHALRARPSAIRRTKDRVD